MTSQQENEFVFLKTRDIGEERFLLLWGVLPVEKLYIYNKVSAKWLLVARSDFAPDFLDLDSWNGLYQA